MTLFLRLLDASIDEKATALRDAIVSDGPRVFVTEPSNFSKVPSSPFAYWAPYKVLELFTLLGPLHGDEQLVISTNPLNADFRYVRLWWEVSSGNLNSKWRPWAKGGSYSQFYYDIDTVVIWDDDRALSIRAEARYPFSNDGANFFPSLSYVGNAGVEVRADIAESVAPHGSIKNVT